MELNEYVIAEIMKLECDNSLSTSNALAILITKYNINVELLMNEKYVPYYNVLVSDILKSNITAEDLINLRNNNWELSSDNKYIVKFLTI